MAPRLSRGLVRRAAVEAGWLAAFILAPALIAVLARDSLPSGLRYESSADEVAQKYGLGDPASFVRYGRYLLSRDPWDLASTGCWPPGMGFVNAALFAMFGEGAFLMKTMILSVLLWGGALYGVFRTLSVPRSPFARFLLVNSIWVFSSFRYWLLITASIYSESKALPLFVLGVALFVRGLQTRTYGPYVASGLAFAAAAYVRAVFDSMVTIACAVVAAIALGRMAAVALRERLRGSQPWSLRTWFQFAKHSRFAQERHGLTLAAVVLGTALLVLVPWKLRNLAVFGELSLRPCHYDFAQYWSYDLPPYKISGNSGCVANPDLCAILNMRIADVTPDLGRRLTLFAIVFSPRAYFTNKLKHFPELWVGTPWRQLGSKNKAFLIEGSISLVAGTIGLVWAVQAVLRGGGSAVLFSGFVLGLPAAGPRVHARALRVSLLDADPALLLLLALVDGESEPWGLDREHVRSGSRGPARTLDRLWRAVSREQPVKVSIIVPTYGREALLCQTLDDALALEWPDYEIVVVDQSEGHTEATEAYLARVRTRIVHVRHRPPSVVAALNRGLGLARGDVVLLLDDDVRLPDRRLIAHHVDNYADATIGGVAGRVLDADHPVEGSYDPRAADPVWGFFHSGWTHTSGAR